MQRLYWDTLEAWRKNPIAKRIVDVVTDYTLGDGLEPASTTGEMGRFIQAWWHHPQNNMALRLPEMVDELTRAGDIFPTLHTNPADGMSYVRLVPKAEMARFQEEISEPVAGCPVPRIDLAERNAITALPAVMARLSIAPFL